MRLKIGSWDELIIYKDGYTRETTRLNGNDESDIAGGLKPFHTQFMQTENISLTRNLDIETANMLMGISSGLGHVFRCTDNAFSDQGAVPVTGSNYQKSTDKSLFSGDYNMDFLDVTWAVDFTNDWTLLAITTDDKGVTYHTSVTTSDDRFYYDGIPVVASVLTWDIIDTRLVVQESGVGYHSFTELIALPYKVTDNFAKAYCFNKERFHPLPKYNVTVGTTEQVSRIDVTTNKTTQRDYYEMQLNLLTTNKAVIGVTPLPLASFSLDPTSNRPSFPSTAHISDSINEDYGDFETVGSMYGLGTGGSLYAPYFKVNERKLNLLGTEVAGHIIRQPEMHFSMWVNMNDESSLLANRAFRLGSTNDYLEVLISGGVIQLSKEYNLNSTIITGDLSYKGWHLVSFGFNTAAYNDINNFTVPNYMYLYVDGVLIEQKELNVLANVRLQDTVTFFDVFDGTATGRFDGYGQVINIYRHKPSNEAIRSLYQLGKNGELF